MQAAGDFDDQIANDPTPEADGVLDHATAFDTAVDVFNPHVARGEGTIVRFLFRRQDATAGLFDRLEWRDTITVKGEKAEVLQEVATIR